MFVVAVVLCIIGFCVPHAFPLVVIGLILFLVDHRRKDPERSIRNYFKEQSRERAPARESSGIMTELGIAVGLIFLVYWLYR
jgi:hypothetical protein